MDWIVKYWVQVAFGGIVTALGVLYKLVLGELKKRKALEAGVRAMLRNDIIKLADKYLDEREIPVYGLENLNGMYDAYHVLGGNGTITKLVEEVKRLPTCH